MKIDEFDLYLKKEVQKEKNEECKKRKYRCYGCPFEEDCDEEMILNSLDEW